VIQIVEPTIITYQRPMERVLFNESRDANPFFHLFEALWMLAGRNNVAPLAYYSSNIAEIASDDGKTFNGAYGYRWRHAVHGVGQKGNAWYGGTIQDHRDEVDQLRILIDHLKKKPDSRRAVLQMWNVEDDLLKVEATKDVCCNTCVYFLLRDDGVCNRDHSHPACVCANKGHNCLKLDMTVCNRSNDLVWGALGANAVHFAFLLEYMAAQIGVAPGLYHQFTNNLHCYTAPNRWEPEKWIEDLTPDYYGGGEIRADGYAYQVRPFPLVDDPALFDAEVVEFVNYHIGEGAACSHDYHEPFIKNVAWPAACAFRSHKARDYSGALRWCGEIEAGDWRIECTRWIQRRRARFQTMKEGANPYLVNELERRKAEGLPITQAQHATEKRGDYAEREEGFWTGGAE